MARGPQRFGGSGGGGKLSPEDQEFLSKWEYIPERNLLTTSSTVQSGLNSFNIGGQHSLVSGGQNMFITNESTGVDFWPAWAGLLDQSLPQNQGDSGVIDMSFRVHTSDIVTFSASTPAASGAVPATATYTNTVEASVFGIEFITEELLPQGIYIKYSVSSPTTEIYSQIFEVDQEYQAGDSVGWWFDHALDGLDGDVITEEIMVLKSLGIDQFEPSNYRVMDIRETVETPGRGYRALRLRTFIDDPALSYRNADPIDVTADYTVNIHSSLSVDVSGGDIIITPDESKGMKSFYVFDRNSTFSPTNRCIVRFGGSQGDAVLRTAKDDFFFYKLGNTWYFKDYGRVDMGVV